MYNDFFLTIPSWIIVATFFIRNEQNHTEKTTATRCMQVTAFRTGFNTLPLVLVKT